MRRQFPLPSGLLLTLVSELHETVNTISWLAWASACAWAWAWDFTRLCLGGGPGWVGFWYCCWCFVACREPLNYLKELLSYVNCLESVRMLALIMPCSARCNSYENNDSISATGTRPTALLTAFIRIACCVFGHSKKFAWKWNEIASPWATSTTMLCHALQPTAS